MTRRIYESSPAGESAATASDATAAEEQSQDANGVDATAQETSGGAAAVETVPTIPVNTLDEPPPLAVPESQASRSTIEEIVVTARRTAESMQDVPVTISALSADDLQREQVSSVQALQGKVPSLVISTNSQMRNTETPAIRGQGAQFGAAPGVIIYFAEVPLPSDLMANNQGGPGKFFDLHVRANRLIRR